MKELIEDLSKQLEREISNTPSGELRNLLCNSNIMAHYLLSPDIIDCSGLNPDFVKVINQLVEIERKNLIRSSANKRFK